MKSIVDIIKYGLAGTRHMLEKPKNLWPMRKLIAGAMSGYKDAHGYTFDVNNPVLFTEKIIWYKLFFHRPYLVNIVDKYLFKDYVTEKIGKQYVVPLYGAWTSITEFRKSWDKLPSSFCLKSTLKSDSQFIIVVHDKSALMLDEVCAEVKKWLKVKNTLINSYCRAYYDATPRIIAEKLLTDLAAQSYDYKIFCFNGEPYCIYTYANRFDNADNKPTED